MGPGEAKEGDGEFLGIWAVSLNPGIAAKMARRICEHCTMRAAKFSTDCDFFHSLHEVFRLTPARRARYAMASMAALSPHKSRLRSRLIPNLRRI